MRQKGALAMRLQDLADYLGVAYTALYHYFPGRDHLVEAILLWTLEQRRSQFEQAAGESALDRLLDYFYRYLTEDLEYKVPFPYIGGFPEPQRKSLLRMRRALLRDLVKLLDRGMAEGSIRLCQSATIANVLTSYLDRFVSLDDGLGGEMRTTEPSVVVREMAQVLRKGLLFDEVPLARASYDLSAPEDLVGTAPGLSQEFDRYENILRASTAAFNAFGAVASIPKIAAGLGVSKTVVYQYAVDKQDLLAQCYLRCARVVEASHRVAADFGRDPVDEALIHRNNLYKFHSSVAGPFTLLNATQYLRPQQLRVLRVRNAGVRATSEHRLARAIGAGVIRSDVHPPMVQPLLGQALYGLPAWYTDAHPTSVMEVAHETGALLFKGLQP